MGLVLASHQICVSPPTTPDRLWAPKKRAIASELSVQLGRKSVLAALEDLPPSVSSDDLFRLLRSGGWSSTVSGSSLVVLTCGSTISHMRFQDADELMKDAGRESEPAESTTSPNVGRRLF